MQYSKRSVLTVAGVVLACATARGQESNSDSFAATFDAHWEVLRNEYPYFDLYGVNWEAEREEHRRLAAAASNADEFAWEVARLISALPDPHISFLPSMETIEGRWSVPDVETVLIERRAIVLEWTDGVPAGIPEAFANDPRAYPEVIGVQGVPLVGTAEILAAGPTGTSVEVRLRWPDGSESDHELERPLEPNLPPEEKHFGDDWLIIGRVGEIGYMGVRTFDPSMATLGPDGKMTTMLRAALRELRDTRGLVLDFQGNGGGMVAASDPFLGNLIGKSLSYRWGNSGGKRRVIRPRSPRYRGELVVLVDARSASGGEWAARILRDAGRAVVVGGRTAGAEAAVHNLVGPDGSKLTYSAWPMIEPDREPFQEVGIEVDYSLPLTLADTRALGYKEALASVRRERVAKALELLNAPARDVDEFLKFANSLSNAGTKRADHD